jgi:hypothetical protein
MTAGKDHPELAVEDPVFGKQLFLFRFFFCGEAGIAFTNIPEFLFSSQVIDGPVAGRLDLGISHGAREGKEDIFSYSLRYLLFSFSLRLTTQEDKREERV